uniref:LRRCT domain-containing protein n=1 Tax=Latimeria chalumnae TaxID=7897 RepID=H2ZU41_LATCH
SQCLPENITHLDLSPGFMKLSGSEQQRVLRNFRRLVSLSLANSFLPVLREEMFSSFENLQALDLSNCSVRQVDPRALGGLPRLATLVLKDNRIRRLDPGVWPDLEGLSALDLRNNLLTGVDGPLMHALGRIGRVRLEGNKWRCDCQLLPMQQWLKSRKGKLDILLTTPPFAQEIEFKVKLHPPGLDPCWKNRTTPCTWQLKARIKKNPIKTLSTQASAASNGRSSNTWQYLVAVVGTALGLSALITLSVKCKFFHKYLLSYRHQPLPESEVSGQYDTESVDMGTSGGRSHQDDRPGGLAHGGVPRLPQHDEDDDGFIEDNYIQASDRREEE